MNKNGRAGRAAVARVRPELPVPWQPDMPSGRAIPPLNLLVAFSGEHVTATSRGRYLSR